MSITIDTLSAALLGGDAYIETVPGARRAPSRVQGWGMFASRPWRAGEVLCVLDGQRVSASAYPAVMDTLEWNAITPEWLLVRPLRTSYGYINHSTTPNVAIDADGRTMRAATAIAAGDELTMDYLAQPVPAAYLDHGEGAVLRSLASAPGPD